MTALTASNPIQRRGPRGPGAYGYQVAASEKVFAGGFVGLNSSGTLQRAQTTGTLSLVGICQRDYDNTANGSASAIWIEVERGFWVMPVAGSSAATVDGPVYATDDATATQSVAGPALSAAAVAGNAAYAIAGSPFNGLGIAGANTGNPTFGTITPAYSAVPGGYLVLFSAATVFSVRKPNGTLCKTAGATGAAFADGGLGFTLTAGGTAAVSGDSFIITVAPSGAPLLLGTLSGFDKGTACVRIKGT